MAIRLAVLVGHVDSSDTVMNPDEVDPTEYETTSALADVQAKVRAVEERRGTDRAITRRLEENET